MDSIYTYTDFRRYLRDFYQTKKREVRGYTYRAFAAGAGMGSASFIRDIILGTKNPRPRSVEKLCRAMELRGAEAEYFAALVGLNTASTIEDRERSLSLMRTIAARAGRAVVGSEQYDYYQHWYHSVVRELAVVAGDEPERLGAMVRPAIGKRAAKKALALLLDKGFVRRSDEGGFELVDKTLTTGTDVHSLAVRNHHRQMARRALEAIDLSEREERDFSGITMGISEQSARRVREELMLCRKRILALLEEDSSVERVYRLNLQLFPLSERLDDGGDDTTSDSGAHES
jgi:uncharacterized protein (TIGR02147 family)